MTTTTLRGRAAFPIRPGFIVKKVLQGEVPLTTGELVTEAAITDLFGAYKQVLNAHNEVRPRAKQIHGMRYRSFYTMFKFAQLLGLVELVREEPMLYPPTRGVLYSVRKRDSGVFVVKSTRRVFKLSSIGAQDDRSWSDLTRAWKEHWTAPQAYGMPIPSMFPVPAPPVVVPPPPTPEEAAKPRRGRPRGAVRPVLGVPRFKIAYKPSRGQYSSLLGHLRALQAYDIRETEVQVEVGRLESMVGDWVVIVTEDLEEATSGGLISKSIELRHARNILTGVYEALVDREIPQAVEELEKLT